MAIYYQSKLGETKTKDEWERWAASFYENLLEVDYIALPDDWFSRITKILKLTEIE